MLSNSLISIIIPTYNVESEYLNTCLDSVVTQSYKNLEIILIDDYSPDKNVLCTIDKYKQADSRITVVKKSQNDGVSITRKQGIEISHGEYIMFLDCDDFLVNDCVELLLNKAIITNADIVVGDYWMTYEDFKICHPHSFDENESNGYLKALLTGKCGGTVWGKLIKSDLFDKVNYPVYNKEDNDVLVNFHIASFPKVKIVCLKKPIYNWMQRKNSVTNTKSRATLNHGLVIIKDTSKIIESHPDFDDLQKELILYKLSTWSLLLAYGIEYNSSNKAFRKEIYTVCAKNKWAMNSLKSSQKMIVIINRYMLSRFFYLIYLKTIKKTFLTKKYLKYYKKHFN